MLALIDNYNKNNIKDEFFNVGLYLRLSREDETGVQSESISNQKEYLMQYVLQQGWNLVDIYTDDGYSGTTFNRPEFQRLIKDVECRRINLIISKDLSRLGRDYIETGYYLERYFPERNVRFIALNDGIDTFSSNNSNNDMSPFKSVMNDMYAKDISKKVRTTMNTKRKNGQFIGAFAPYGYKKSPEDKNKLVIDKEVAPIVARIFELYLSGWGYAYITHELNSEMISTPSEYKAQNGNYKNSKERLHLWTTETIRRILTNPTYAGNVTQNRCSKINYKVKKLRTLQKDQWITVENTHEPIIDKEAFYMVQEMMSRKANDVDNSKKFNHILAGLVFCADCGERMTFTKTQKGELYSICSKYKRFKRCTRHSILENELEALVINELRKISESSVNKSKMLDAAKQKLQGKKLNNEQSEMERAENRLAEIKRTIKHLYEDKLKGIITETDFLNLTQEYNQEREQLILRSSKLQQKLKDKHEYQDNDLELMTLIKEFIHFDNVSKPVLTKLIKRIEIAEDKKITIHYNFKKPF